MSLIDAALSRSRTVIASLVLILAAGMFAYVSIPKESDPDVNIPIVYVSVVHEGISPEDSERLLIRPLEEELRSIEGVKEMKATGYEGGAYVILEFDAGFDVDQALTDVREGVDDARPELPEDSEEPTVHEVNLSLFPVLVVTLSGNVPERTLQRLGDELKDAIESIPAVLEARIAGEREEVVEIIADPVLIESYGLSLPTVLDLVAKSNRLIAAGAMDTGAGRFTIKVPGLFETLEDILDMPLKVSGDAVVRVSDIGEVRRTFKDRDTFARVNGQPAVALEVSKRTGENIIETIEKVRALVEAESALWPDAVEVSFSQDKSTDIRRMLADLQNNVISAILLVMIVIVGALGLRSAGLVGVAIPGSFLAGILVLYVAGLTVNIVVLFSLILAVGMLVDGAIVVTELADRKMAEGLHRREAYALAAKRMAWPIIASTATTLAAFLPLMFWPGVVGEFMKFLPITLIATLSASLLMALIFVPTLGAYFGKPGNAADTAALRAVADDEALDINRIGGFTGGYVRTLNRLLDHPGAVLLTAGTILIGVYYAYGKYGQGVEFFPSVEPDRAIVQVHARGNLSVTEKDGLVAAVERRILGMEAERHEFDSIYTRSGNQTDQRDQAEDVVGSISLEFADWQVRRRASVILDEIVERTADIAGIVVEPQKEEGGPPTGKDVQVEIASRSPELLAPVVERVRGHMEELAGLRDIEDSRPLPGIDWEITVDRGQALKYGADVSLVGSALKFVTKGLKVSDTRPNETREELDIIARYPDEYRTLDQLDQIRIQTEKGLVPISNFVKREARPKVGTLNRVDGKRVMTVKANVHDGVLVDEMVRDISAWIDAQEFGPGIDISFKGQDEESKKAAAFLSQAFMVALFLMTIILVTQFNSFYSAALILSAVIMSTVGVLIGLMVIGMPFGTVMNGISVVALAGIVVNNNIVLIDTFDRLRKTAKTQREAILRTGAQRLRPVVLTSVTTILGLLPMVLGVNIDFVSREVTSGAPSTQWWIQLSSAIAFGLAFATLLTLLVTPSALMARANVQDWRARRRARRDAKEKDDGTPSGLPNPAE
ncbi:MAG: efflux RND transporter permease subunit [Rhodospirillaceae bacterium]|jgi:multidrug efflux pump|nr:efflux RND transporter permease subunit [Rhodospirillaceae bacterium]MBT6118908.1 efflux RND transporter permease subunit [Rhodospirillaceae bacterium]